MQVHHIAGYIQSIYLVEYTNKLLLLDGCCRADVETLSEYIQTTINRPITDLTLVLVTHMHPDHAGAAHKLRKLTGCKIASADKETHWYRNLDGVILHWVDIILAMYVATRLKKPKRNLWYPRKLTADYCLSDGNLLPGFPDWQVLETPGHTDRDLSAYHADSEQIYVADLTVKVRNKYIPPFPLFHPNKYKRSLEKVKALRPKQVLLAHGGQVTPSIDEYNALLELAPDMPQTPWRAKAKIRKLFQRRKTKHND